MRTPRVQVKRKLLALVAAVTLIGTLGVASALGVHVGEFELDKDTANDQTTTPLGYLASNISATATSLNVCEILEYEVVIDAEADPPVTATLMYDAAAPGDEIILRQEVLTVVTNAPGNFGGSCAGAKRVYTVEGPRAGTTQQGGSNNAGARLSLIVEGTATGPDWDDVFAEWTADNDTKCEDLGLVECTFIHDGIGPTIFTQGSTKDHLPIAGWFHTDGSSPDKGEIINAYAAKAIDEDDFQILYFGMDRYAVDGSTDIGFWFFQDQIVACPDEEFADMCEGVPDGEFAGEHIEGDLLALGTFTQGGATTDIRLFMWVDSGGNEQEHIEGPVAAFADCVPGSFGDNGCATVNNTTIQVPWTYMFKGESTGGWIPLGGFYEGGINLTANNLEGCFSSFLAETRASPEVTAILKDFALGEFEACDTEVTTTPSDGDTEALSGPAPLEDSDDPGSVPDIMLGTGAAGADVTDAAIVDVKGINEWDGTLSFYLCGPIPTDELCDGTENVGVLISSHVIDETDPQPIFSDVANLTEIGYYCWRGFFDSATDGVPDATDASVGECFEVLPVEPDLTTQSVNGLSQPFSGPVPFGSDIYDEANLTGTANEPGDNGPSTEFPSINATNGDPADGDITFTLYVDAGDSCGAQATGDGLNPEIVDVEGDGLYYTSGFAPDSPGLFAWAAEYSGSTSGNTLEADHNLNCQDAAENYTVQQLQPGLSTAQSFIPNDSVTVTVEGGAGALDGQVTFNLYVDDPECDGTAITFGPFDVDAADVGATLSATAETSNTTEYFGSHTFRWDVDFTSNNPAHLGIDGTCGFENSSTTVNDGGVENTPPSS